MINDRNMSDDEKKFVGFWIAVFGSAIGFWVILIRWMIPIVERWVS